MPSELPHPSIRGYFANELHKQMESDPKIRVISCDLGYGMFDRIRQDFPEQFINVGSSEQAGMGVAVGLAMEGKKPFIYSISPFLIYRPFETIRNYIDHEKIPVRMIGSGLDDDYSHDGFSHHIYGVTDLVKSHLPNVDLYIPEKKRIFQILLNNS